ncbi:hypothetical protein EDB19DRAFT_1910289 [Suillus lakei]|nr:hypothetical protein EDB19DRAFT_1910289 [Suillus lakei]
MGGLMPGAMACAPPEVKKEGWSALKECDRRSLINQPRMVTLSVYFLHAVFNPTHPPPPTTEPPHPPP